MKITNEWQEINGYVNSGDPDERMFARLSNSDSEPDFASDDVIVVAYKAFDQVYVVAVHGVKEVVDDPTFSQAYTCGDEVIAGIQIINEDGETEEIAWDCDADVVVGDISSTWLVEEVDSEASNYADTYSLFDLI